EVKGGSFRLGERGAGIVERAVKSAAAAVLTQQFSRIRALNPPQPRFKEKPRLPKRAGLELDRVRPLKSPVSPSAPTRNVAFGSAPDMQRNGHPPAPPPSFGQKRWAALSSAALDHCQPERCFPWRFWAFFGLYLKHVRSPGHGCPPIIS